MNSESHVQKVKSSRKDSYKLVEAPKNALNSKKE
jgi:hypothetical protein